MAHGTIITRTTKREHEFGAFQLDASQDPHVVKVDYEGVTGTFDPQDLLSLLQMLPDNAGSTVVTEALRISRDRR